jgi:hypothetical protein
MTRGEKLLVAVCVLTPLLFAGYALLARGVLRGPVTERSLARSVAVDAGAESATCRAGERPREHRCTYLVGHSRPASYRVRVDRDSSCWTAARIQGHPEPRRRSGCVHRWQWRLLD